MIAVTTKIRSLFDRISGSGENGRHLASSSAGLYVVKILGAGAGFRAEVVLAEAEVPQAMANAFQQGNLRAEDSI